MITDDRSNCFRPHWYGRHCDRCKDEVSGCRWQLSSIHSDFASDDHDEDDDTRDNEDDDDTDILYQGSRAL